MRLKDQAPDQAFDYEPWFAVTVSTPADLTGTWDMYIEETLFEEGKCDRNIRVFSFDSPFEKNRRTVTIENN